MDNFQFWKNWSSEYKKLYLLIIILLFVSTIFYVLGVFTNIDFILGWSSIIELTTTPIDYGKFTDFFHEFKIEAFNYLIYEKYTSPLIELNPPLAKAYLFIVFLLLILFLTFSTTLSKFLYYSSTVAFILFLSTLNLDLLNISQGFNKNFLTISIILFAGASYAIYTFYFHLTLLKRFLIFSLIALIFIVGVFYFSPQSPTEITFHLIGYSSSALIILTGLFIIYIGIENTLFLVYLNSNSSNKSKRGSLSLYIAINILYLLSLTMMYVYRKGFVGVNAYTLFIVASILTIWGTLKRNESNTKGDTFARVIIISIISAISVITIGYHAANGNSSLIKAFEREIVITFLCYGGLFFLYVLVNFIGEVKQKLKIYKVIFQPIKLSTYHMYVMGTIASMALFVKESKKPYYQAVSGYYNTVADSYIIQNDYDLAETYYEFGRAKDPFNHRSNLTIANLAIKKRDLDKAILHYKYAISREPSIQSYIQLSNLYSQRDNYFDALFTLQEGIQKFPNSYQIYNNLGILSKKSDLHDSTFVYFSKATELAKDDKIPFNNLITFLIKRGELKAVEKIINKSDLTEINRNTKTALSVYNAKNGVFNQWKINNFKADTNLRTDALAFMFNHFINNINLMKNKQFLSVDTTHQSNRNVLNGEQLTLMKGFYEFYNGDPKIAREHLATLASSKSFYGGYYNNLLGQWLMLQKNYELANKYFEIADKYNFQGSKFNHAFVLTIINKKEEAINIWKTLAIDPNSKSVANSFLTILTPNISLDSLSEYEKLLYATFNKNVNFPILINSVSDSKISTLLEIKQIESMIQNKQYVDAVKYCDNLESEGESIEFALNQVLLLKAEAYIYIGKNKDAIQLINSIDMPIEFKAKALLIKSIAYSNVKEYKDAEKSFNDLTKQYPFYKDGLLATSRFLKSQNKTTQAYNILVDASKVVTQSPEILQEYALLCLDEMLIEYGDETILKLKDLMNKEDFIKFNNSYQEQKAKKNKVFDDWENTDI